MKKFWALVLTLTMVFAFVSCGKTQEVSNTGDGIETVVAGSKITTDFVELTIAEAGIKNDLRTSITKDGVTKTFGPYDSSETDYAYIKGTIVNKTSSNLKNEIIAKATSGKKSVKDYEVYIYEQDGETAWDLAPDTEYGFIMCVELKNKIVEEMKECNFSFGFNKDMGYSFEEVEELDYKYNLIITPEAK